MQLDKDMEKKSFVSGAPDPNPLEFGSAFSSTGMHACFAKHCGIQHMIKVGHRGMGSSYTKSAVARENTIFSFLTAFNNDADYVEFDVQMTKDKRTTIFHDFHVMVWVAERLPTASLEQVKVDSTRAVDGSPLKCPQLLTDNTSECEGAYFERNQFVDSVLSAVMTHAGKRKIILTSLTPTLSVKQKKYPVLILCLGVSIGHVQYADERVQSSRSAVKFAHTMGLIGVCFNSTDILQDPKPVEAAKMLGLISFIWGDNLGEQSNVEKLKGLGVEGIILGRIGEGNNGFTVEQMKTHELFFAHKSSTSNVGVQTAP